MLLLLTASKMDVDLVLLDEAADARDLAHSFDGIELVAHVPVLDRPQFREVEALALDRVPVDLPESGRIGAEHGHDARRQPLLRDVHALEHTRARPVVIDVVLEDDERHREPEARHRPDRLDAGRAGQAGREGERDLIIDVLRAAARPVGVHDDLLLADVGDRIHRRASEREVAADAQAGNDQHHQEDVPEAPTDDRVDHGGSRSVLVRFRAGRRRRIRLIRVVRRQRCGSTVLMT
jgi:hypothetical protein